MTEAVETTQAPTTAQPTAKKIAEQAKAKQAEQQAEQAPKQEIPMDPAGQMVKALTPARLKVMWRASGTANSYWSAVLDESTPYEAVFARAFWAHHGRKFVVGDTIRVTNDTDTLYAELYVRASDRLWAEVAEIVRRDFQPLSKRISIIGFTVEHKGPHRRYCVIRQSDNSVLREGILSEEEAFKWVIDHQRAAPAK